MRKVKVAAVQMRCTRDVNANIANAEGLVRKAAADGAQIILLPELFERQYFWTESACSTLLRSLTQMEQILESTERPISRMTTIIRKNSTSHREIRGLRHLRPAMAPSAWASAGTSGSRRPRDLWR